MKISYLVLGLSILLTACGGSGIGASAPKMEVTVGGKSSTLQVKSGFVNLSEMVATAPGKPDIKTSAHTIYVANYEMDTSTPGWMRKPLTTPEQIRVDIQVTGEDGTTKDSPFKIATYSATADKVNLARFAQVITFSDGKQTETRFDDPMNKMTGDVKITSVTAETVSGEINLSAGDRSIKGNFTAKLPVGKK